VLSTDTWQEIWATVRANKLRTALTAFGVFWGLFMLIVMLGAGSGLSTGVHRSMGNFATNSVWLWGGRTAVPYRGMQPGRRVSFDNGDVDAIRTRIDGIAHLAPRNQLGGWRGGTPVIRGDKVGSFGVVGDVPDIRHIDLVDLTHGRFINDLDIAERRKVAVLGAGALRELYEPGEDPIGTYIEVSGVYFQVVGATKSRASGDAAERHDETIYTPFTTFQQAFHFGDHVQWIGLTAVGRSDGPRIEREVEALIAERHDIAPDDGAAIGSFNMRERFGSVYGLLFGITLFIWIVGVATLLAGVIGVSNIMLIAVKERTREIGVRKALGATPWSVVSLILQESVLITAVSGYIGLVLGIGAVELIDWALVAFGLDDGWFSRPRVSFDVAVIAASVLIASGALAGVIPARHAARVHPVEALRAE
jgi:putative ABC transport system permease protein